MVIIDFTQAHISQASALALACYNEERRRGNVLPHIDSVPNLEYFARNGMGVAAIEGERLVGYLCAVEPFENAFGTTTACGVFSPMGANGTVPEDRAKIYAAMYAQAARKWVRAGAVSHGICLYAHDDVAQQQFFHYGFGMRCVDAIRPMEPVHGSRVHCSQSDECEFVELTPVECRRVYPLVLMLHGHLQSSPCFMNRTPESEQSFENAFVSGGDRCFVARSGAELWAYIQISDAGETFITENNPKYCHITGAFCLPQYRGRGIYQNLMNFAIDQLKRDGFTHLGVDFESINPAGYGFWSKYFTPYTCGVVRRIDEGILSLS